MDGSRIRVTPTDGLLDKVCNFSEPVHQSSFVCSQCMRGNVAEAVQAEILFATFLQCSFYIMPNNTY